MTQLTTDLEFELQTRTILRQSEHQLDERTEQQLVTVRQAALTQDSKKNKFFSWPAFPVAVATMAIVAVLLVPSFSHNTISSNDNNTVSLEDKIEQELEFYQWLLETDAISDDSKG